MNLWDQVLARIETKVNRHSFYTWFKPTSFVDEREGRVQVRVPNTLFRDWLTKHYAAVIDELIRAKPAAAKGRYLRSITLASTMGPGLRLDTTKTRDLLEEAVPTA